MNMDELEAERSEPVPDRRLPHLAGLSERQDALVTTLNAATSTTDAAANQLSFAKLCEQTGVEVVMRPKDEPTPSAGANTGTPEFEGERT
jgi:hypothetical protein